MKTAHYFKSKKEQYVIISGDNRPVGVRITVTSKSNARNVSKDNNAKPWNF